MWMISLLVHLLLVGTVQLAPTLYPFTYNLELAGEDCTISIIENRDTTFDTTYSTLKQKVQTQVANIYKASVSDSDFYSASVEKFSCLPVRGKVAVEVKVTLTSDQNAASDVKNILVNEVSDGKLGNIDVVDKVGDGGINEYVPLVHNSVTTEMPNAVLCQPKHFEEFRENMAKKLLIVEATGLTTADKAQIVFSRHACSDTMMRYQHAAFHFYVAKKGNVFTPDSDLTILAYKVVDQMIYEGSTWKFGLAYDKKIDDIVLFGADDGHTGLSDVEIIFLGFGIVCALLALIILIVLLSKYYCECCQNDVEIGQQEKVLYVNSGTNDYAVIQTKREEISKQDDGIVNDGFENVTLVVTPDYEYPKGVGSKETHLEPELETKLTYRELPVDVEMPIQSKPGKPSPKMESTTTIVTNVQVERPATPKQEAVQELVTPDVEIEIHQERPATPDLPKTTSPIAFENLEEPDFARNMSYTSVLSSSESESDDSENDSDDDMPLTLAELLERSRDDDAMTEEFGSLELRFPTPVAYAESQNTKNRESNKYPWTHKRVALTPSENDPDSDYINASFVKSITHEVAYINTQAPMKNTVDDFWQMIWERDISVVVMGTCLNFRGEEKCVQYWPNSDVDPRVFGKYTVTLGNKELKPDYVVTRISVTDNSETRELLVYRFMSWPSYGLPSSPQSIKSIVVFLMDVQKTLKENPSLAVFHGSNARGFGAVLLAIYQAITQYDSLKKASIKQIVRSLRKDQPGAIENSNQYKYIYKAVCTYAEQLESGN